MFSEVTPFSWRGFQKGVTSENIFNGSKIAKYLKENC